MPLFSFKISPLTEDFLFTLCIYSFRQCWPREGQLKPILIHSENRRFAAEYLGSKPDTRFLCLDFFLLINGNPGGGLGFGFNPILFCKTMAVK